MKIKTLILSCFLLAFCSSACIKYNSNITVDSDGIAAANISFEAPPGITKEYAENLADNPLCEIEKTEDSLKAKFKPIELEKLDLQNIFSPNVVKDNGLFFDDYTLRCLEWRVLAEDEKMFKSLIACLKMNGSINWSISLPCAPNKHNAPFTENDGKTLVWTTSDLRGSLEKLEYYENNYDNCSQDEIKAFLNSPLIYVNFRLYHYGNIAGAALTCLLAAVLLILYLRRKKTAQCAPANHVNPETQPAESTAVESVLTEKTNTEI